MFSPARLSPEFKMWEVLCQVVFFAIDNYIKVFLDSQTTIKTLSY